MVLPPAALAAPPLSSTPHHLLLLSLPTPLGEALSDLHHTHHATVVVLLISSLSTTSCGIKNVESSSSCTCGSLGGVARAALGQYISSRLDESSCGDRLANPCLDKTRSVFFEGEIRSPSCYHHLVDLILFWVLFRLLCVGFFLFSMLRPFTCFGQALSRRDLQGCLAKPPAKLQPPRPRGVA